MYARLLTFFLSLIVLSGCAYSELQLCDNITLKEGQLNLNPNEKVMVCGSPKGNEGWRHVPLPQAQYQLKVILQERGYLKPRFERNGNHLDVWSGPQEKFSALKVYGGDGLLRADKKRKIIGEPITPDKLDELNQWAETELRTQGFACPKIDVRAQAWDGVAKVSVAPGLRQRIASLKVSGMEGLDGHTLDRYLAFAVGDSYDVQEMQLTVSRLMGDGLAQTAYFTTACRGSNVDLHLHTDLGKPRLFRFGVGASTEEFPFADVWFKNSRLDNKASSLTMTLHASPRLQSLNVNAELYVIPWSKYTYLGPRFTAKRKSETFFEELSAKIGADIARAWDMWSSRFRARGGPTLNYVNTVQGKGPDDVSFFSWEGSLWAMSHKYEVGTRTQWDGWEAGFEYDGQRKGVGSYINVDRYEFDFKYLWNMGSLSPPLFVLGTRGQLIGIDNKNNAKLPSEYRIFYGGDDNLRGFGRQVLNNDEVGYLTALYLGLELRLVKEMPYGFEPFLLSDFAKLGDQRYHFGSSLFTSWGVGLRWASPVGTWRASAARGEIYNEDRAADRYPQEWVYFFSFGREF